MIKSAVSWQKSWRWPLILDFSLWPCIEDEHWVHHVQVWQWLELTVVHFITAKTSVVPSSLLLLLMYFPAPSTLKMFALIFNEISPEMFSKSLTSSFDFTILYRKENMFTFSVLMGMSGWKISKPALLSFASYDRPMHKFDNAHAGTFMLESTNWKQIYDHLMWLTTVSLLKVNKLFCLR